MKTYFLSLILGLSVVVLTAQSGPSTAAKSAKMRSDSAARTSRSPLNVQPDTMPRGGGWARMEVENGDTVFVMSLWPVRITDRRQFKDPDERRQYLLYKNAARKVYPYALEAIEMYEDYQDETAGMTKRQRRRFMRHEHHELKEDMTDQMKSLSKTQGKVLIKMIEKEVGKPFYEILRETRGGMTAAYWNNMGKLYGYDLKEGYQPGADPLLDEVFLDYDFGDPMRWYQSQ